MLLLELPIRHPLLKTLLDVVLAETEHILRIPSASLLQAPGRRVVEIKLIWDITSIVVALKIEALLHLRISG